MEMILPKKTYRNKFLAVFIVIALAVLACNLPGQRSAAEPTVVPFSPEEAQQFEQNLQETITSSESGREVSITVQEGQLSSYLAAQLADQSEPVVTNPRVRLTNGRMEIYAQVKQGVTVEAKTVVVPSVDSNGQPRLLVESVNVGSFPVPESMISQMQGLVDNLFADYLTSSNASFRVSKIEITEGQLTVSGTPE